MSEPYVTENFHILVSGMMSQHKRFICVPQLPLMNDLYIKAIDLIQDAELKTHILLEYLLEYMVSEPIANKNIKLFQLPAVKAAVQGANFDALSINERALLVRNTTLAFLMEACSNPMDIHAEMNELFKTMPGWTNVALCVNGLGGLSNVTYHNVDLIAGLLSKDDQAFSLPLNI